MNFEFGHLAELENVPPDFSNNTERSDLSIDNSAILSVIQGPPRNGNFDTQASFNANQPSWMGILNRKGPARLIFKILFSKLALKF